MAVLDNQAGIRLSVLGNRVTKSTGTLAATTVDLFLIAGGLVAVTSIVGRVTTAITVANSYKLVHTPTVGTAKDLCTAADIGTTDTIVGEIFVPRIGTALALGAAVTTGYPEIMETGKIQSVSAGTDGVILWSVTWAPIDVGATLVAA